MKAVASLLIVCALGGSVPAMAQSVLVGGDHDSHGCKGSAGYNWSPLRKGCIRIFEEGVRLDPQGAPHGAVLSAFAVFRTRGESDGPAEVYVPGRKDPIALTQVPGENAGIWRGRGYTLRQWKGMLSLEHGKTTRVLYQGPLAP